MLVIEIQEKHRCSREVVTESIRAGGHDGNENKIRLSSKEVSQFDLDEKLTQVFSSRREAARWLINNGYSKSKISTISTNIGRVVSGERKTCLGFIWK